MRRKHIPMLVVLAIAAFSASAIAVQLELTPAQVKAVCDSAGGCGPSTGPTGPTGPTEPTPPITCPSGQQPNQAGTACENKPQGDCGVTGQVIRAEMDWANPKRLVLSMAPNDAIVVAFTTGSAVTGASLPRFAAAEYQSSPSSRTGVLSDRPCDFGPQSAPGAYSASSSIQLVFYIGASSGFGYYPVLKTNTQYFVNIKNNPNSTCVANDDCKMFVDLVKVGGL